MGKKVLKPQHWMNFPSYLFKSFKYFPTNWLSTKLFYQLVIIYFSFYFPWSNIKMLSVRSTSNSLIIIDEGRTIFFFYHHNFPTTHMISIKRLKSLLLLRN